MGIVDKEYTFGVNTFKKPNSVTNGNAIGTRLMELIMTLSSNISKKNIRQRIRINLQKFQIV